MYNHILQTVPRKYVIHLKRMFELDSCVLLLIILNLLIEFQNYKENIRNLKVCEISLTLY